jgi:threonine dehydrogenase-like Zn-dependent dehydrogenase
MAEKGGAAPLNYDEVDVIDRLKVMTGGMGPDSCIDCVGMEAHGFSVDAVYDRVKQSVFLATDRLHALRQAIQACRKGGVISVPGVYGGVLDKFNFGAAFAKGLTFRMGQTHVQKYMPKLLSLVESGLIEPSNVITHRMGLDEAPEGYKLFNEDKETCIKIVLLPGVSSRAEVRA